MTSIGDTLRRERLRRGLSLEQVAAETKISHQQLEAMEADQFDRLPGGVFTRSFLRQYARALGVDEEEVIASLKAQFEEPAPPLPEPEPPHGRLHLPHRPPLRDVRDRLRSDSSFSAFVWLVLVVLACAAVYSVWQHRRTAAANKVTVARVAAPQPAPAAGLKPVAAPAATPAGPPKPEYRRADVSASGSITEPQAPVRPAPTLPVSAPTGAAPAVRVALSASEPVWVSIKSDGARVFSGTIDPQQPRQFDASARMLLFVGNAGGLEINLNGKPVGPFGPRGEIRLLELTPAGAHIVPRTPPTPPPTSDDSTEPGTGTGRP